MEEKTSIWEAQPEIHTVHVLAVCGKTQVVFGDDYMGHEMPTSQPSFTQSLLQECNVHVKKPLIFFFTLL